MIRPFHALAVALLVSAVTGACAAETRPTTGAVFSHAPQPSRLAPAAPDITRATRLRDTAQILDTISQGPHAENLLLGVTDHEVVLGRNRKGVNLGTVLRDLTSVHREQVVPRQEPGPGVHRAVVDRHAVVWTEAHIVDYGAWPWRLYSFDRRNGRIRKISEGPKVFGHDPPPPPGWTGPALFHGSVFWAQTAGRPDNSRARSDLYMSSTGHGRPRRIARGAAYPAPTSDGVYYLSSDVYAGKSPRASSSAVQIRRYDLRARRSVLVRSLELTGNEDPIGFAAADGHLALTMDNGSTGWVDLYDLRARTSIRIDAGPNGDFAYPVVTDRLALWAEGNAGTSTQVGGYLYDFKTRKLYSVGNMAGLYNLRASGSTVAWQEHIPGGGPAAINILVGRLP